MTTILPNALLTAVLFTVIIVSVEMIGGSKVNFKYLFTVSFFLYLFLMTIGNLFSTLMATTLVKDQEFFKDFAPYWAAFLGVFGFEIIIQKINLTFWDQGVLTISAWINKAKDSAIASAIKYAADKDFLIKKLTAERLATHPELKTHALQAFGQEDYEKLLSSAHATPGIDVHLYLALAFVEKDLKSAQAITKAHIPVANVHAGH